jgi:hypothetical protein
VQTFLPYPDFAASAAALDDRRLGKQRVEALQVLRALTYPAYGWKHHPAVRMWEGYPDGVAAYGLAVCAEWTGRGRPDTCAATISTDLAAAGRPLPRMQAELASGCTAVTARHWCARIRRSTVRCSPTPIRRRATSGRSETGHEPPVSDRMITRSGVEATDSTGWHHSGRSWR